MPTIVTKLRGAKSEDFCIVEERQSVETYLGPASERINILARAHPTKPGHKVEVGGRGPHVGPHWRGIHELGHGVIAEWVSEEELQGQAEEPTVPASQ